MVQRNSSTIEVIGSVEFVDLVDQDVKGVPARVDTGAIFSAIWASDVKFRKGTLSCKLFAPGNAFYTGEVIKTTNFRTSSVKNSFGHSEFRYKIRLSVCIGDHKVRSWFTLADRSGMTYPVLIGRNILRSKFIVDVSQRKTKGNASFGEVLVLASEAQEFDKFFREVEDLSKLRTHYTVRDYKDLIFSIKPGLVKVAETKTNKEVGEFDLVYFKSHKRDYPLAISVAQYLQFRGVKIIDQELLTHLSYDKLSEYMRLALHNIPVPNTFCASTEYIIKHADKIGDEIGWPLVCKEIESDRGRKNYLIHDAKELKQVLKKADKNDIYVVQQYIPNNGFVRTIVFDRDVALALHRSPLKREESRKQHLNKRPYSNNVKMLKLNKLAPQIHDLSVRSSVIMNRQVAGVDLIQDTRSNEWFILEVNSAPQLKSGPFFEERKKAVANFIDSALNR